MSTGGRALQRPKMDSPNEDVEACSRVSLATGHSDLGCYRVNNSTSERRRESGKQTKSGQYAQNARVHPSRIAPMDGTGLLALKRRRGHVINGGSKYEYTCAQRWPFRRPAHHAFGARRRRRLRLLRNPRNGKSAAVASALGRPRPARNPSISCCNR